MNLLTRWVVIFILTAYIGNASSLAKAPASKEYLSGKQTFQLRENETTNNATVVEDDRPIFLLNKKLGRGINLSGLEQAVEGQWSFKLRNDALATIADGGFDSVRLPIKWDSRALARGSSSNGMYPIESAFFERVDGVVADALSVGLRVIINMHLYEDLIIDPESEAERFLDLWDQIATHYADHSDALYFEILNEPAGVFSKQANRWNTLQLQALQTIRQSNPERAVLVAPVGWNLIENLPALKLPADNNLIVSVHYYEPGQFTHQGAEWVEPMLPVGVKWFPQQQRLGSNVQNWSWDTDLRFNRDAVDVKYLRSGAALNFYSPPGIPLTSLSVSMRGRLNLAVICGSGGDFVDSQVRLKHSGDNWKPFKVDLKDCPVNADQIALQNLLEGERFIKFRGGELCRDTTCSPLFLSNANVIEQSFETASLWGKANSRPMNLGEFGAYGKADFESRVRWTKAVQEAAQQRGMSSHYWEFEQGFGIWSREDASWRNSLHRALIPSQ